MGEGELYGGSSGILGLPVGEPEQQFGGQWTSDKIEKLKRYLRAYNTVFKKQAYLKTIYIDAFAGSGLVSLREETSRNQLMFPEFGDELAERFVEGSTRAALQVEPAFGAYYFIERNPEWAAKLEYLRADFPDRASLIQVLKGDANEQVSALCKRIDWRRNRAVLFLDPYGMQVEWKTLEIVAATGAIDVWYLFPLGVGVNRLLPTDGQVLPSHKLKLDSLFGATDWRNIFYTKSTQQGLFGGADKLVKTVDFDGIEKYLLRRLGSVFPKVTKRPARLLNSKRNPLYTLCFASSNPGKGGVMALKIADHIMRMR